jgi:hypothetical protein
MGCKMPWWAGSENPPPDKDKIISELRAELTTLQAKLQTTEEANAYLRSENARIAEDANDEANLNAVLMTKLEAAEKDARRWNWLVSNCDGNSQDDFTQWLARTVASKEAINAKADAAIEQSKEG